MRAVAVIALAFLLAANSAPAAPFVNLDFEQATVPSGTGSQMSASLAFPGWTARYENTSTSQVYYDNTGLDQAIVALYDKPDLFAPIPLLQGHFDAFLRTETATAIHASLSQGGDIPTGIKSLHLLAEGSGGPPIVTFGGTNVPMTLVSGSRIYGETDEFAGDITAFAGSSGELQFTSPTPPSSFAYSTFDAISFSPIALPEPSSMAVAGAGLMMLMMRRRGRHVPR